MEMPVLKPVPIPTRDKGFWGRLKSWLVETRKWEFVEDYYFYVECLNNTLKIPKGFIFDGASIPRLFWNLLVPDGILFVPSFFHDFGYRHHYLLSKEGKKIYARDRKFFDKLFLKISYQVNGIKTPDKVSWFLLRLFGWMAYNGKH